MTIMAPMLKMMKLSTLLSSMVPISILTLSY